MEAVVLHRVGFLAYFCPKQGQDFKPSAAPLFPNMGQVPPPPSLGGKSIPRFTKSPSLVLKGPIVSKIQRFKNVKINKEMSGWPYVSL